MPKGGIYMQKEKGVVVVGCQMQGSPPAVLISP